MMVDVEVPRDRRRTDQRPPRFAVVADTERDAESRTARDGAGYAERNPSPTAHGAPRTHPILVPLLAAGDELTPEREHFLTALAHAARAGDRAARDALYLALLAKIDRFVAGCGRLAATGAGPQRDGIPCDAEDLAQEAFPLFVDVVAAWPGDAPFGPYFLAHFPWRLRSVWRSLAASRRLEIPIPPSWITLLHDGTVAAEEARVRLEALAADLPPPDGVILLDHVRDGESLGRIARRLGLSRRTVTRRWQALVAELRRGLRTED